MRIKVFTTGGTIDKVYFDAKSEFAVGPSELPELLHDANISLEVDIEALMHKDSLELTDADRMLIRARVAGEPAKRIVITHGTDTMVETAQCLEAQVEKTIVLVGSMQPARVLGSDAAFNVGFAFAAVQLLPPGVYLAMNGCLFDPRKTRKNRALNRFEQIS